MSIKMSLDTPALERLFKDDNELEVQLKQGVIMNFVNKHMMALLKDEFLQTQIKEAKDASVKIIEKEIGKVKVDTWGQRNSFELSSDIKKTIKDNAFTQVNDIIIDLVKDRISKLIQADAIDKYIEKAVEDKITELTKVEIQKRADKVLKSM